MTFHSKRSSRNAVPFDVGEEQRMYGHHGQEADHHRRHPAARVAHRDHLHLGAWPPWDLGRFSRGHYLCPSRSPTPGRASSRRRLFRAVLTAPC